MGSVVPLSSYRRPGLRKAGASGPAGRQAEIVILPVVRVARPEPPPRSALPAAPVPAAPVPAEPGLRPS
ncbi:hypothetical protein [Ancylobacter lacus]|uniref:hypothetical protein n=1 Tax=Ancylobacter lacus TaxID=2579970 RepID=UPI001BD00FD9|nr:hypothetical protein [Ancylobacter lacus]MBS7539354.1 hypothetical protein [Ancylobacter lacus]